MDKVEIWDLYQWIRRRLTEDERKLIQAMRPNLLIATEREFAIHLKSKIILIMKIIGDPASLEKTRN
jgi:hypothetical protein